MSGFEDMLLTPRCHPPRSAIRIAMSDPTADNGMTGSGGRSTQPDIPVASLALGEPGWDLPKAAAEAMGLMQRAPYGPHVGHEGLRRAISRWEGVDPDRVLITTGAQGALHALVRAYLGPGDTALVPDPGFPGYAALVQLVGAEPVPYTLPADQGFRLDPRSIALAFEQSPNARVVFLNHPSNPTGAGASGAALREVSRLCRERGALLVSDEVYRHLHPRERATPPGLIAAVGPQSDTVVISSVSKAWGAPGLRVGWMLADPRIIRTCTDLHAWSVTSAAWPCQIGARALIEASDTIVPDARRDLERRWRRLETAWEEVGGPSPSVPDGGIYAWFRLPTRAAADPVEFCARLRQGARVAVVPGLAFGEAGRHWARLSFAGEVAELAAGVRRLVTADGVRDTLAHERSLDHKGILS